MIFKNIIHLKSVSSTNDYAKENPSLWQNDGFVVITDEQTKGRGQNKNKWLMNKAKDLAFSICFTPKNEIHIPCITIIAGAALYKTVVQYLNIKNHLKIKWPNDIMYQKKKLAGILCESIVVNKVNRVIVGIGLNVNSSWIGTESLSAVSLLEITDALHDVHGIMNTIVDNFSFLMDSYEYPLKREFIDYWNRISFYDRVRVSIEGIKRDLLFHSILPNGYLLLYDEAASKYFEYNDDMTIMNEI
jgi:biotin-[acetyl-CoA-carboxylase] ligase BirA-like protein